MTGGTELQEAGTDFYQYEEEFRNTIATVDEKGRRIWVYPKKPSGTFHRWRVAVTSLLLALLFAGPFLRIGGKPLLLLNFFERKFVIFGQAFWPQDFVLLAILLVSFFVFIILFTVVFGRIWCGWMCPQTLFMEMVFRKIEYWIEGDANEQRRLNKEPWNIGKIVKKSGKQIAFLSLSLLIAHTAMSYLIGIDATFRLVTESPVAHPGAFAGMIGFTLIFYSVFAWFREQACVVVCPYGRLQSVLLVKDSIVVAYDWIRGEPRTRIKKNQGTELKAGHCIDCKLCVHVCPTGIDIRNGTQLECVNCTACIDACDEVMEKVNRPKGLIRYASHSGIQKGTQRVFTPRVIGYSFVLTALLCVFGFTLLTRSDVETTILKVPGTLFQRGDNDKITNLYNVEFVNKTFDTLKLDLRVIAPADARIVKADGKGIVVPAEGLLKAIVFIELPASQIVSARTVVQVGVFRDNELIEQVDVKFIGPVKINKQ